MNYDVKNCGECPFSIMDYEIGDFCTQTEGKYTDIYNKKEVLDNCPLKKGLITVQLSN